jgi:hypothetical protein
MLNVGGVTPSIMSLPSRSQSGSSAEGSIAVATSWDEHERLSFALATESEMAQVRRQQSLRQAEPRISQVNIRAFRREHGSSVYALRISWRR